MTAADDSILESGAAIEKGAYCADNRIDRKGQIWLGVR